MNQIEIIGKRKKREKHFLQDDGTIVAEMYNENVHFLKNGQYEEIDNTLILKDDYYINRNNEYSVSFASKSRSNIIKLEKEKHYIYLSLDKFNDFNVEYIDFKNKLNSKIIYQNVLKNIDIYYDITPSKIKENIVINNLDNELDKLVFNIETDLVLKTDNNGSIRATYNGEDVFIFDSPYMIDSKGKISNKLTYNLIKDEEKYQLFMFIDKKWLESKAIYPVIIDPTITSYSENDNVYDTFIYPGDTNINRNNLPYLKAGVEKVNGNDVINRTLLKFNLPTIGTGSQVVKATLNLTDYPDIFHNYEHGSVDFHRITQDWDETTANWDTMNNKYDSRVEGMCICNRLYYTDDDGVINYVSSSSTDITSLVQKWYTNLPNYGIMLKTSEEIYKTDGFPMFFSKNNAITSGYNPKPLLIVTYRNQNGLENYMEYEIQEFTKGKSYHNIYNGNLTQIFEIGLIKNSKMPLNLNLVYNTNDVVLKNNIGYGRGYRLNFYQTIKEEKIDEKNYIEYTDEDGTLHYFLNEKTSIEDDNLKTNNTGNIYYDEDGLDLKIEITDDKYVMYDKSGNQMIFEKYKEVGYLTEIKDISGNISTILYDAEYKKILGIRGCEDQYINIIYNNNYISIISPLHTVELSYLDSDILSNIIYETGTVYIFHNENYLVSGIRGLNGKGFDYEYYSEIPYKLKKVTEIGIDDIIGNYYNVEYGFNTTSVIDSKNRIKTIAFNNYGNPICISSLKSSNDITNAYGYNVEYGESINGYNVYKNKLLSSMIPVKYVKNILKDTSFENSTITFLPNASSSVEITEEYANLGSKSLKFRSIDGLNPAEISQEIKVTKGKSYTFSAYIKTISSEYSVNLCIGYYDENGDFIKMLSDCTTNEDDDFERLDATIFYSESSSSNLILKICMNGVGTCFIDNVQLEEGEVANNYNLIDNSDFSDGFNDWNLQSGENYPVSNIFNIVNIDNQNALKVNMFTSNGSSLSKKFNISGKAGDHYVLSFWYKNKGLNGVSLFEEGPINGISITFYPDNDTGFGGDTIENYTLNPGEDQWQFFIHDFYADYDFKNFELDFYQVFNGNEFYITNINFFKDVRSVRYDYDSNGNLIKSKNLNNQINEFNYDKNNQLVKMTEYKGANFHYEYDNTIIDRLLRGVSGTGISNEMEYDEYGNPIISRIIDRGQMITAESGIYKIRLKGTNRALRLFNHSILLVDDIHGHDKWNLEKVIVDGKDYYKIFHSIIDDRYLTNSDESIVLSAYQEEKSLFELEKQDNGSFHIKNKSNDKYIKNDNNFIVFDSLIDDDENFEFYFESITNGLFIENSAQYTSDGRFIEKTIDTNFKEINYDIDPVTGNINSITNSKNQITHYNYDNDGKIIYIMNNDRKVSYEYNNNKVLSKIIQDDRVYSFEYDKFLNVKSIKLGDSVILVDKTYENNNGNLLSITYGNNQTINYEYDEFDRISKTIKGDDTYSYKYNNNGDLIKIISNNDIIKYTYDLAKRLYEYQNNNFKIKYNYDVNDNVISKKYSLDNINHTINNILNEDDSVIKTSIDNDEINYNYDGLGRLVSSNINNNYETKYQYITNGKRTSTMVKSISNNGDKYTYKYDSLNNITHIYHNGVLENEYYYDEYNQLVKENNYITNKIVQYEYDNLGNILYKTEYEINTKNKINQNKYEYNNLNWKDQLTKFDNIAINYDNLGNPISIGDNIKISWINGRQMNSYVDSKNVINYRYNKDGLRISKIINNKETKYYLEGEKIVLEQTDDDVLYYLYDGIGNIIGFEYKNNRYYYIKNNQNDIIAILNNNYNIIAKYIYDSWGNIISITDENGIDVSDNINHIANINPYRYRSYYYDKETKLYYLNSRYYNPKWCRFINTDRIIDNENSIQGNLYVYCANDPINKVDLSGSSFKSFIGKVVKAVKKIAKIVKNVVDKIVSSSKVTRTSHSSGTKGFIVKVEDIKTKDIITSKTGNDDSLFKIIEYDRPFDINDLKSIINIDSLLISTNNRIFDVGLEIGNGWAVDFSWKQDSGNGVLSIGANLFGQFFIDVGHAGEVKNNIQKTSTTNVSINILILAYAFAHITVPEFDVSKILKSIFSKPKLSY